MFWIHQLINKCTYSSLYYSVSPGCGTNDKLFTPARTVEGVREFAQLVYICFVDLEKAYDKVLREIFVGGAVGVRGERVTTQGHPIYVLLIQDLYLGSLQ